MIFIDNISKLELYINDNIIDELRHLSLQSYPKECGGFLVGNYSNKSRTANILQIISPSKSIVSNSSYERDTDGMEELWDNLYQQGLIYLGEWHSHPNGNASYSSVDKRAITQIAACKTVNIENPIMLILGINKDGIIDIKAYYYKEGQIIEYE